MFGAQMRCDTCNGYKPDRCVCAKDPALKGVKGGNCNRQACQKSGADWYNKGTYKYYCQDCATLINFAKLPDGSYLCSKESGKYWVSANWEAIQCLPDQARFDLNWVVENLEVPNSVFTYFEDHVAAQSLYDTLSAAGLSVFRSWKDHPATIDIDRSILP